MPVTTEPRGLNLINNLNMTTAGSLNTNVLWFIGSVSLTAVACWMLTRLDQYQAVGPVIDGTKGLRQMLLLSHDAVRTAGLALVGILVAGWTGKTTAGVFDANNKRKTHPAYAPVAEAKERAQVAGAAAVALAAEKVEGARAARITSEHEALAPIAPVTITAKDQSRVEVSTPAVVAPEPPEQEWATGDTRAGVL